MKQHKIDQAARGPSGGNTLGDDILWGAEKIAEELGLTMRQAYHQLYSGQIPAAKHGGKFVASRAQLRSHFDALLGAE